MSVWKARRPFYLLQSTNIKTRNSKMLTNLLPAARSGSAPSPLAVAKPSLPYLHRPLSALNLPSSLSSSASLSFASSSPFSLHLYRNRIKCPNKLASAPISAAYNEDPEKAKLAQVFDQQPL